MGGEQQRQRAAYFQLSTVALSCDNALRRLKILHSCSLHPRGGDLLRCVTAVKLTPSVSTPYNNSLGFRSASERNTHTRRGLPVTPVARLNDGRKRCMSPSAEHTVHRHCA